MACLAKHVTFEPPAKEWVCPKCRAKAGDFCVDELQEDADWECPLLHPDDYIKCMKCGFETSGRSFSARIKKKLNMVPCPACKGKGHVKAKRR